MPSDLGLLVNWPPDMHHRQIQWLDGQNVKKIKHRTKKKEAMKILRAKPTT